MDESISQLEDALRAAVYRITDSVYLGQWANEHPELVERLFAEDDDFMGNIEAAKNDYAAHEDLGVGSGLNPANYAARDMRTHSAYHDPRLELGLVKLSNCVPFDDES